MEDMHILNPRKISICVLALTVFASASLAISQEKSNPETKSADASPKVQAEEEGSPEFVLRKFLISMGSGDADSIKEYSLPDDDIGILLEGEKLPKEAKEQMHTFFRTAPIKRLKVGDKLKLPNGKTVVFDASQINEKQQMLSLSDGPLPFALVKTEKQWKVDPKSLIAARKAAKAAMEKQRAKKATDK